MKFEDRDIVITGGASGIGKAIALKFAALGNRVHLLDIDEQGMECVLAKIGDNASKCYQCDITDFSRVKAVFAGMREKGVNPSVLINSAGIAYPGYVDKIPVSMYEKVMQINYLGTVNTVKAILPVLLERGEGHIANISSLCALISVFGYTAYGASKFAVRGFTESLHNEIKFKNIRVSMLCPPDTDTPQLTQENKIKPRETFVLADSVKPMTADQVATCMIKGMQKNKFLIIPGLEGKFVWVANRWFPGIAAKVMESKVRRYYARQAKMAEKQLVASQEAK